ncbi:MAG: sterol desaturase family protein [Streptosporangiaceae bacterium]
MLSPGPGALAHLGNHRIVALWRLHAIHHSQEEVSILTTYRAHPLVHLSFLLSAIPVLAVESNAATPAAVLTGRTRLGALPHANVRWWWPRCSWRGRSPARSAAPRYHARA